MGMLRWRTRRQAMSLVTTTPLGGGSDYTPRPFRSLSSLNLLVPSSTRGDLSGELVDTHEKHAVADSSSASVLRQQLQFFRSELRILRSRQLESNLKPLESSSSFAQIDRIARQIDPSPGEVVEASSLAQDIYQLRAEIAELRAQQQNIPVPAQLLGPASDNVQRELGLLRGEIEELRAQQLDDPVPEYSSQAP